MIFIRYISHNILLSFGCINKPISSFPGTITK
nr:MAG TPA: hypothetical protein [Caudoviricetes sp.]